MLPGERGAGAGPQRVKALEVPGAARSTVPYIGAPMRRGPPAPSVHRAGTFALFLLPGGRPRRFVPEPDLTAAEEAEGSMLREESADGVVLEEESEVSVVSRRLHLKGAAGFEASNPSVGIRASAQRSVAK
jgi:hypothetical protein